MSHIVMIAKIIVLICPLLLHICPLGGVAVGGMYVLVLPLVVSVKMSTFSQRNIITKYIQIFLFLQATSSSGSCPSSPGSSGAPTVEINPEIYCRVCGFSFNSTKQAHQHYHGKNHAKKLRLDNKRRPGGSTSGVSSSTPR